MLTPADIDYMRRTADEYDSLLERWRHASAGSQELANLHATFQARAGKVGQMVEGGLFRRVLATLAAGYTTGAEGVVQPPVEPAARLVMGDGEAMKPFITKESAHLWIQDEQQRGSPYAFTVQPLFAAPPEALLRQAVEALNLAIRQNSHDMLMTGEELRRCESAIAALRKALKEQDE